MTQENTPKFDGSDDGRFGPAMKALNVRQRAFVISMLETGRTNNQLHAQNAGYCGTGNQLAVQGYRLAHDERIQAAINEEAKRRMNAAAIIATSRVVGLLDSADEKVQLKAAEMIFNRTGLHATTEHKVTVEHIEDDKTLLDKARRLASELGLDVTKLIGYSQETTLPLSGPVIDGEFTEAPAELSFEESLAQVEDI